MSGSVQAQISSDGTLPTPSQIITLDNLNFTVSEGSQTGTNLFHSFSQFSVPTNGSVVFNNAPGVLNIIGRVTGTSISTIDGSLGANGLANVFLINPNGIAFGANASLDIGGSFLVTTANSLRFADGTEFMATANQPLPVLTVTAPTGLQFGQSANSINVQGDGLAVQPGNTLALVGGEVSIVDGNTNTFPATLAAPGGRIEIGSVASNSLVSLTPVDQGFTLDYENVQNFQDISLSQLAIIDVTDLNPLPFPFGGGQEIGSGDIQLQGQRIRITGGSQISSQTAGDLAAGTIILKASEVIDLSGTGDTPFGAITSNVNTITVGNGSSGDIVIKTQKLLVRDGATIFSASFNSDSPFFPNAGQGASGAISIFASDSVVLMGSSAAIGATGQVAGASSISIRAIDGLGGELQIQTARLMVSDGASISVSTMGNGQGGTLNLEASDSISVSGTGIRDGAFEPSTIIAESTGAGIAGDLNIQTRQLNVLDGGEINASSAAAGNAGLLSITADNITLDQGNLTAATAMSDGGNISLQVSGALLLGNASQITAAAGQAATGIGDGGNIEISAGAIAAVPGSDSNITADAGQGQGGNINLTTQGVFGLAEQVATAGNSTNDIDASSDFGLAGTVSINTPETDPSQGLTDLPTTTVDPSGLVAQACPGDVGETSDLSEFVVTGRGGLPTSPDAALSQAATSTNWVARGDAPDSGLQGTIPRASQAQASQARETVPAARPQPIVEAQGWVRRSTGEIVLTTATPSTSAPSTRGSQRVCQHS